MTLTPNLFAPRYAIEVEGTKLKEDVTRFVSSVTFTETENQSARIAFHVINDNFRFLDSKVFAEGNSIDLWMGYAGKPLHFMARGTIVRPNPNFPREGIPTMSVVAHDASRRLMNSGENDKGRTYGRMRDSEIAESLYGEVGIAPFTYQTKGLQTRVRKRGNSRWQFLLRLAKLHNFVVFVKYDATVGTHVGFFGPPDVEDQPTKHTFSYGTGEADATLLEFHPDLSIPSQSTNVQVVWTDPKTRKTHRLSVEARRNAEKTKFTADSFGPRVSSVVGRNSKSTPLRESIKSGTGVTLTVFGQSEEVVVGRAFKDAKEAKRFVAAWFARREAEFAFGNGTIVGSPDVRRGQTHAFKGLGNRLSGDWQLTSVTHRISGGTLYETNFSARKVVLDSVVGAPDDASNATDREVEQ